jgi:hypothetical protein
MLGLATVAVRPAAAQDDEGSQSQLGGYTAGAAGWAFSFQPVIPALLPTGDAPVETTFSLSSATVKSGGNSLGRGSIFWPGSAAANLGPLLGTGAGQPFVGGLVPPYPGFVEASAKDGEQLRAVSPLVTMRAFGSDSRAEGDVRTPDVNLPGLLKIDSVSSNSAAEVTDIDVTSSSVVHLEGVSLVNGAITFAAIHSRSLTRSTGATSSAEGDLQVVGLKVSGIAAELTGDGIHAIGLPEQANQIPGVTEPFPNMNPDVALNQALAALGASIKLTRSVEQRHPALDQQSSRRRQPGRHHAGVHRQRGVGHAAVRPQRGRPRAVARRQRHHRRPHAAGRRFVDRLRQHRPRPGRVGRADCAELRQHR